MNDNTKGLIQKFMNDHIGNFHDQRIRKVSELNLDKILLSKNPYLFRAKNLSRAADFVEGLLQAGLSSSEETSFGSFLEDLALFVSGITCGGIKSSTTGIDLDLTKGGTRYLISIKSGNSWSNASSHAKLVNNFQTAVKVLRQNGQTGHIQPTLGICYGKFSTTYKDAYLHIGGQSFWHLISDDSQFYVDIIEPLGYHAEENEKRFKLARDNTFNKLVREFTIGYCNENGEIEWPSLVEYVSKNMAE